MIDIEELRDRAATFGSDYLTDEEWVAVIDRLDAAERDAAQQKAFAERRSGIDMNDHELQELAAKAQGWFDYPTDSIEQGEYWHTDRETAPFDHCFPKYDWNPHLDDGDALRLAVKIHMFDGSLFDLFLKFRLEEVRVDGSRSDEEIIRRAIVRVAAEVGRHLK